MNTTLKQAVALALALGVSSQAYGIGTIWFDRDGAGGTGDIKVDKINWNPNSALFDNLLSQTTIDVGGGNTTLGLPDFNENWTFLAQGQLGSTEPGGGDANCNLSNCFPFGDNHFTFELGLTMETDDPNSQTTPGDAKLEATMAAGGATNYFKVYFDPNVGAAGVDDAPSAGKGTDYGPNSEVADPSGVGQRIEILSGTIVAAPLTFDLDQGDSDLRKLDSFNDDNRQDIGTYVGNGSIQFDIRVDTQDNDYFVSDLTTVSIGTFLTTTIATPFGQVNPALSVQGVTPDYGNDVVSGIFTKAGLDGVNGPRTMDDFSCGTTDDGLAGEKICDTLVQTQWTQSFNNPENVPEPGSLALLGISLAGFGLAKRRRSKTA